MGAKGGKTEYSSRFAAIIPQCFPAIQRQNAGFCEIIVKREEPSGSGGRFSFSNPLGQEQQAQAGQAQGAQHQAVEQVDPEGDAQQRAQPLEQPEEHQAQP